MEIIKINPHGDSSDKIEITDKLIENYSLKEWARSFTLMTAGYRDQLNPNDPFDPRVAFNIVTVAILGEAKARVLKRHFKKEKTIHLHIGGETRPHTQDFISILARVYAAHNFKVHLRARVRTTPVWYSSYGIFYEEFQSGENLTASHSPFFKGGWKPMDSDGKQLLTEEEEIIGEVKNIVESRNTIYLAPWSSSGNILHDFDVDEPYVRYLESIVGSQSIDKIKQAGEKGFRCSICPLGGSMKATSERLFHLLDIPTGQGGIIQYFLGEEDSQYHKIGVIDGDNFGVDPTKEEIYKNIGAQQLLLSKKANVVFIWDPDGDRFNIVTSARTDQINQAEALGLKVDKGTPPGSDISIVYFSANQIFLMLSAYRIALLKAFNLLNEYDWFISCSISTSYSLEELAIHENIPIALVRVGFKYNGTLAEAIEKSTNVAEHYVTLTATKDFPGKRPRAIIMCEESGGASFGSKSLLMNKSGTRGLLALREKDGIQTGLLTLALAASLYNSNLSFLDYYNEIISKYNIKYKYFVREDRILYKESLIGAEREIAKKEGENQRDGTVEFFKGLAKKFINSKNSLNEIGNEINARLPKGYKKLPYPKNILLIGEEYLHGVRIEFDTFLCIVRASGTDALLRYYFDGEDQEEIKEYKESFINLQI